MANDRWGEPGEPWGLTRWGLHPMACPLLDAILFVMSLKAPILGLLVLAAALSRPWAAAIPVHLSEGSVHGFVVLRTVEGAQLAQGDLIQVARGGAVESHMILRFDDGSLFHESVVFTQTGVFTMQSYRSLQRGPSFPEDTEISLERATGAYRVRTRDHKGGRESVLSGSLRLPGDTYNGMVFVVGKNLPKGTGGTVHFVAFTPQPRIIQLEITPANEQKVLVGKLEKAAVHYVFRPRPGAWLKIFAALLGRSPPDLHAWFVMDEVPAFVRFEGPLYMQGPVWRIQLTSPRWLD